MPVSERELQNVPILDEIREAKEKILKTFNSLYDTATDENHRYVGVTQTFPCFCQGAKIPTTLTLKAYPKKPGQESNFLNIDLEFEKPELLKSIDQAGTFKYFVEKVADGDLLNQMAKEADLGNMKKNSLDIQDNEYIHSVFATFSFLYPDEGQPVPEEKEIVENASGVIVTINTESLDAFTNSLMNFTSTLLHDSVDKYIDSDEYGQDKELVLITDRRFSGVLLGITQDGKAITIDVLIPMNTTEKNEKKNETLIFENLLLKYQYSSLIFELKEKTYINNELKAALLKEIRETIRNSGQNDPNLEFVAEYAEGLKSFGADSHYNIVQWHIK